MKLITKGTNTINSHFSYLNNFTFLSHLFLWGKFCKSVLIALFIRFYFISLAIPFSVLLYVSSFFIYFVSVLFWVRFFIFFSPFIHFSLKISSYFMNSVISDVCKIYNISVFKCPPDISLWSPQAILIHHDSIPQKKNSFHNNCFSHLYHHSSSCLSDIIYSSLIHHIHFNLIFNSLGIQLKGIFPSFHKFRW